MTADFSGSYGSGGSMYTYTFGPNLSGGVGAAKAFVHALFGGVVSEIPDSAAPD